MKPLAELLPTSQPFGAGKPSLPVRSGSPALPAARDASGLPVRFDRECDREIRDQVVCFLDMNGAPSELRRDLTADERAKLTGRAVALTDALAPYRESERNQVDAELSAMLSGFRSMRQQGEAGAAMIEVTMRVLAGYPFWAIAKGCLLIASHQAFVPDGRGGRRRLSEIYAPNDAEIRDVVEGEVKCYREALIHVNALLIAPVAKPQPPRPSREEVESKLGRSIGGGRNSSGAAGPIEPGHTARVMKDLERRMYARQAKDLVLTDVAQPCCASS